MKFVFRLASLFGAILNVRSKNKKKTKHNQALPKTSGFNADERGEKRGIRGNDCEDRVNNPENCTQSRLTQNIELERRV